MWGRRGVVCYKDYTKTLKNKKQNKKTKVQWWLVHWRLVQKGKTKKLSAHSSPDIHCVCLCANGLVNLVRGKNSSSTALYMLYEDSASASARTVSVVGMPG